MSKLPDIERRQTAFRMYVRLRNISRVSKETGIPAATLHVWKKEEQWDMKLSDIQTSVQGQLEVLKEAQTNIVVKDQLTELQLLELLQGKISTALVSNSIAPTTWQDVIKGLEFINKEKRLILGQDTERVRATIDAESMNEEDLDKNLQSMQKMLGKLPQTAELASEPESDEPS